ncbi:MAG: iron-containing alcohol dehydrogenase [Motiliproteus sp.]
MTKLQGNWSYPNSIHAGAGRVSELPQLCQQLAMQAPLLITDPVLATLPMVCSALDQCRQEGLRVGCFSEVQGNPTGSNVMAGVDAYRAGNHDGVIAFGGGSCIDAAKAVALMVGQNRPLWDFEDVGDNWARVNEASIAPIIAVPTTAGTGSEVGRAAMITDQDNHIKRIIFHPEMLPTLAILDPELTTGLPPLLTAATGIDALSHNLEALCSPSYHPMAEGIAMEGARLVKTYLPRAVMDGNDLEARMQMLVASSMGATAFQKGLGAMHAIAHPLGALYDAHHGMLNAILMPYVLKANREAINVRIERLSRYLDLTGAGFEPGFDGFLSWVLQLRQHLGIPHSLAAIEIEDIDANLVGLMAAADATASTNPILFDAQQYAALFKDAVHGRL